MSYVVRIRDTAERDLAEQQDWYEQQASGLGQIFNAEVERLIDTLAESPSIRLPNHR